jgi:DNA-binding MarR family transcriptional regulator
VDSIGPAAAQEFSLLPAQNTSGNWVKVVQRVPMRMRVEAHGPDMPLRAGMSVEVDVDTGHARGLPRYCHAIWLQHFHRGEAAPRLSQEKPDLSQNELAAIAEVSPTTIARLERLRLVKRWIDPADRRIRRLQLTPAAVPPLRPIKDFPAKLHSVVTEGIEPAVLETMALGLHRIKENLSNRRSAEVTYKSSRNVPLERIAHRLAHSLTSRNTGGCSTAKHQETLTARRSA